MSISKTFEGMTVTVHDDSRQRCEVWSRIMGYYAVHAQYNEGKKSEFRDRKFYAIDEPALTNGGQQRLEV